MSSDLDLFWEYREVPYRNSNPTADGQHHHHWHLLQHQHKPQTPTAHAPTNPNESQHEHRSVMQFFTGFASYPSSTTPSAASSGSDPRHTSPSHAPYIASKESVPVKPAAENLSEPDMTKTAYGAPTVDHQAATLDNKEFAKKICDILQRYKWYHGLMPRDEIEEMLVNDGDFLVRRTEVDGKTKLVVSTRSQGRIRHILIRLCDDGQWRLYNVKLHSLPKLIEEHVQKKIPAQTDGAILKNPIKRPDFYILHENVVVNQRIGGGAFGDVYIGKLKKPNGNHVDAAIKMLKGVMTKKERTTFMKEAKIMRRFHHANIVNLLGVAAQEYPVMIILELCPNGALNSKLKKDPKIPVEKLIQYTVDACRGMVYLSDHKIIHRDIAARNCLLGKNDEAKISDFGLSVADQSSISVKKLKQVPIRWLAPETLRQGQFSTKTDVWSFGVMIWEIFTRCKTDPYPGMTNADARLKILSKTTPMELPSGSPESIKYVMQKCFTQDSVQRPTFADLFKILAPHEKQTHDNDTSSMLEALSANSQRSPDASIHSPRSSHSHHKSDSPHPDRSPARPISGTSTHDNKKKVHA